MEKKISLSTVALCISVLEMRVRNMQSQIDSYDDFGDVPSWLIEARNESNDSIDELRHFISL